ncbi:hypothetical protein CHUAL_002426 [Chamberlinius hualienensis]
MDEILMDDNKEVAGASTNLFDQRNCCAEVSRSDDGSGCSCDVLVPTNDSTVLDSSGNKIWSFNEGICNNNLLNNINTTVDGDDGNVNNSSCLTDNHLPNHYEVNCNCIQETSIPDMNIAGQCDEHNCNLTVTEVNKEAFYLRDSCDDGENLIKDCSYVNVLVTTNDQGCDYELEIARNNLNNLSNGSSMKQLSVDETDCLPAFFDKSVVDNYEITGELCGQKGDIMCECSLISGMVLNGEHICGNCDPVSDLTDVKSDVKDFTTMSDDDSNLISCLLSAANSEDDFRDGTNEDGVYEDLEDSDLIVNSECAANTSIFNDDNSKLCDETDAEILYDNPTECGDLLNCESHSRSLRSEILNDNCECNIDEVNDTVNNGSNFTGELGLNSAIVADNEIEVGKVSEGDYNSLEEENFYEEIRRNSGRNRSKESEIADQTILKRGGLVGEVMNEVERVQKGHAQILQELNLDIENLIMPVTPTASLSTGNSVHGLVSSSDVIPAGNSDTATTAAATTSTITQRNQNNNLSTRTLPPLPANSVESAPVLRSAPSYRNITQTKSLPVTYQTPNQSPSGVKQWFNKLSSFRDKKSKINSSERARWRLSLRGTEGEPVYMLYDDSHKMHEAPKYEPDDGIYEDIDKINQKYASTGGYSELPITSSYRDRQSASTIELNDDFSDTESVQSSGSLSVSSFKGKILNFGRKLSRQNDEKGKEIKFKPKLAESDSKSEGKLTRLFSKRKGYDLGRTKEKSVVTTSTEEETLPKLRMSMRQKSPALPPLPNGLAPDQIKRRYVIGTLVQSENSYIESLKKLVNEYKKPLEESSPPILSASKVATLFYQIPEILQCHMNFCISLAACIRKWDKEEKLGDVFIQAFSKNSVLDNYSDYINNFSVAVDLAKQEAKRKSAFTDFLKVKQITSQDRLSLFGLMVKPVQRFPQFILLLQDLLKHTPQGHHDRMQLQLALTQMETLTDILNERKRESDQSLAVKDILRHVSAKSAAKSLAEGSRYLLRQDSFTQLVFSQNGQWKKSKVCRLFLLNDLLVCVTVGPSSDRSDIQKSERFTFKWSVPVREVEVHEEASPILNNMVQAMSAGHQNSMMTKSENSSVTDEMEGVKNIYQELGDLLHDFEVMSRIMALVTTLKKSYPGLDKDIVQGMSQSIQQSIQKKDDEVKWIDSCCLQFSVPLKTKTGKIQRELMIFQSKSMDTKQEWLRDVRMSQLALDESNSPAWNIPESSKRFSTKTPLYVNAVSVLSSRHMAEIKCGCCHRTMSSRLLGRRTQDNIWLCSSDGVNSHISIHTLRQKGLRDVYRFDMTECRISTMESVPGIESSDTGLISDTVWMGTESRRVLVYSGSDVDSYQEVDFAVMAAPVLQIKYHLGQVYVALANGTVACFRREGTTWLMKDFHVITLSSEPVTCLLPIHNSVFCGCGKKVWVIDSKTSKVIHSHVVHHDHMGSVYSMAHSGIGLWLNLRNTPLVCLYHAETFQHLQDVNISSSIRRILGEQNRPYSPRNYCVTTLTAILGLLWIGTNVGIVLSIALPRLQGMPVLGRRANMAYHANCGPVSVILELQSPSPLIRNVNETPQAPEKKLSINSILNSHKSLSTTDDSLNHYGMAKSLPRCWKPTMSHSGNSECNVYGLYDNLINVREGNDDQIENDLRRSDPDLIPSLVSTLDRRLRLHSGRPRSLDLANLTNLIGSNDLTCVSSSSEDGSGSQSFTELPECYMSVCSQIKESNELSETTEDCQIVEQVNDNHVPLTIVSSENSDKRTHTKNSRSHQKLARRSVMTLIGGRGYVDLKKLAATTNNTSSTSTSTDAYAILWEMKV